LNAVSIGKNPPHDVNVVIEVPIGGEPIKYEMDKDSGALQVDRFLYTSMRYPGNYGFIPHTLSGDGDPCDVIVANTRAIVPGAVMSCKIVGVLIMEDEAGEDEKLLAVPSAKLTKRYANVNNYSDLPSITIEQIEHFFAHYKDLEPNKWVKIVRWGDADEGRALRKRRRPNKPYRTRRRISSGLERGWPGCHQLHRAKSGLLSETRAFDVC
jgi:inorganic pyrophosphatase